MDFSSSSHAPITTPQGGYDVFISFRGEDTRNNFTSHLYTALREKQIETFIDTENIRAGDEISGKLLNAIEGSKLYLVIFSPNYAFSKWCLLELEKILVCKKMKCKTVVPVFYKVDPSDVRHQKKNFEDAFRKHEGREKMDKVQRWRDDLKEAASLSGWAFSNTGTESELVKNIVDSILKELNKLSSTYSEGLVGIDAHIEELKSLLCMESQSPKVCSVGIWGMGGIGKTTVARAFCSLFSGFCFFENVREEIALHGVDAFKIKLLKEILDEKEVMKGTQSLRSTFTRDRLRRKKVLIVLDDVDNSVLKQLPELETLHDLFGPGSKVVITSRDKQVLKNLSIDREHSLKGLDHDEALQLFSLKAFKDKHPPIGHLKLAKIVVNYAEVLGSAMLGRDEEYWKCALDKIGEFLERDIEALLRVSYNALSTNEQNIFLDIACFFKGEDKDCAIKIFEKFRAVAECSVANLIDKCLATISHKNTLEMHQLLQQMGQAIANGSRLNDAEKIYDILTNKKGTEEIQSIVFDLSKLRNMHLPIDGLVTMDNLHLLKVIGRDPEVHHKIQVSSNKLRHLFWKAFRILGWNPEVHIFGQGLQFSSKKLRYLHWEAFPLRSVASTFYVENLMKLSLPEGKFKQLWTGAQHLVNLKWLGLSKCKYLKELPDLSNAKNVETIDLSGCQSLVRLHSSVQHLTNLQSLNLIYCFRLRYLPRRLDSMSLQCFDAFLAWNMEDFPHIVSPVLERFNLHSGGIKEFPLFKSRSIAMKDLLLSQTSIEEVPSSIQSLTMLSRLDLSYNQNLSRLPTAIWELKSLTGLNLSDCPKLEALPEILQPMESLQGLDLSCCYNLKALPNNISHLKSLQRLSIRKCKLIRSIPTLPQSLFSLCADYCESLETLSVRSNCKIEELHFTNCHKLDKMSREEIIALARIQPKNMANCIIILPGTEIPQWFPHRSVGSSRTMPLPSNSNHLLGLSSCIVLQNSPMFELKFKCYDKFNKRFFKKRFSWGGVWEGDNEADHMLLGKFPNLFTRKEPLRTCCKALIEVCLGSDLNHGVKQFGLDFHFGEEYSIGTEEDCQKLMGEDAHSDGEEYSYSDSEEYSISDGEEYYISTEEDLLGEDAHSKGGCDNYCPIDVEISTRTRATDEEEEEKSPPTKKIKIQ